MILSKHKNYIYKFNYRYNENVKYIIKKFNNRLWIIIECNKSFLRYYEVGFLWFDGINDKLDYDYCNEIIKKKEFKK